jgi:hypothetical protein
MSDDPEYLSAAELAAIREDWQPDTRAVAAAIKPEANRTVAWNAKVSPGHTDLMVSPEAIDEVLAEKGDKT